MSRTQLLSGFSDPESELSELVINNLAVSSGSISGNGANGWTYTPEADFYGEVTLSYAVTDPDGASTLAAYTFNVDSINDAPERAGEQLTLGGTQEDNNFTITENQLLAGYFDADGDELSVTTLTLADDSIGSLTGDAQNGWTFSPNPDFNGTVELNYSISDGQADNNSTIDVSNSFQVFAVNDVPSLTRTMLLLSPMAQKTPRSPSQQPTCSQAFQILNKVNSPSAVSPPMAVSSPRMEMALTSTTPMPTSTAPSPSTTPSPTPMVASLSPPSPLTITGCQRCS